MTFNDIVLPSSIAVMLFATFANAQTIPSTSLCNTGLTHKSLPPQGCTTTTLVTPINPIDGGPFVDGNWELAEPYPSVPATQGAPNPCLFDSAYAPVPANAPWPGWYNPDDQLSQWIEPLGGGATPAGWYIYRTGFVVPAAPTGYQYIFHIPGQLMVDNSVPAIYLQDFVAGASLCGPVAALTNTGFQGWTEFKIVVPVVPATRGYLYFVVENDTSSQPTANPTGLRVEFMSPSFVPIK